jgi:hypothetical protein
VSRAQQYASQRDEPASRRGCARRNGRTHAGILLAIEDITERKRMENGSTRRTPRSGFT